MISCHMLILSAPRQLGISATRLLSRCSRAAESPSCRAAFIACIVALARPVAAQRLTPADSALVGRILLAEDRRDSSSAAFDEGKRHRDPRIQYIARRAEARVRDAKFAM